MPYETAKDEALALQLARAYRWYCACIGLWVAFNLMGLIVAPSGKLVARTLILAGLVDGAVLVLAVYLARGLRIGRRIGGAIALVAFFVIGDVIAWVMMVVSGIRSEPAWPVPLAFACLTLVALRALVALVALALAKPRSADGGKDEVCRVF